MKLQITPYPKDIKYSDGYFGGGIFPVVKDILYSIDLFKKNKSIIYKQDLTIKKQGYKLDISRNSIVICYADLYGKFYAELTLYKIIKQFGSGIPCLSIYDYPTVLRRGVQLCFGQFDVKWNAKRMKKLLEDFALMGANELYLYFEWNLFFSEIPFLPRNGIKENEMKEFVSLANKYHIEVIPQLNLLGHSKEILDYEIMREYKEGETTFCPSNSKTLEFVYNILDKICQIFSADIVQVGGDEVGSYGVCKECSKKRKESGALGIFFEYYGKINDFLKTKNKKMGLWSDQILKLLKDSRFWINTDQELQFYYKNLKALQSMADNLIVYNWWYNGEYDESCDFFNKIGIKYMACGSTNGYTSIGVDLEQANNLYNFYSYAERNNCYGEVTTDWMNVNGFMAENCLILFGAGLSLGWCGASKGFTEKQNFDEFCNTFNFQKYGKGKELTEFLLGSGTENGELLSCLPVNARGLALRNDIFMQTNPLYTYIIWGKEILQARNFAETIEKYEKKYRELGNIDFIDLPIMCCRFLYEKIKCFGIAFDYYNKASKVQFSDSTVSSDLLEKCATQLETFYPMYFYPLEYAKKEYKKCGNDYLANKRIKKQISNLKKLVKFIRTLKDGHRTYPSVESISDHLFSPFEDELFGSLTLDWQKDGYYTTTTNYKNGYFYKRNPVEQIRNDYDE